VDVHAKLTELREVVVQARSMPMSASAVVNRAELLEKIDEVSGALEAAFTESQKVIAERDRVVTEGRHEAEQIVKDAHDERDRIISDTDVYRVAKREADHVVERARVEADELRKETDDYVDAKLANFEIVLTKTLSAVERGRQKLSGRHELDALAQQDVEEDSFLEEPLPR
jgi:cell division septum initiation protein DivIVA